MKNDIYYECTILQPNSSFGLNNSTGSLLHRGSLYRDLRYTEARFIGVSLKNVVKESDGTLIYISNPTNPLKQNSGFYLTPGGVLPIMDKTGLLSPNGVHL